MTEKTHRIFVYGTLMKGERNHHLMAGTKLINGHARTKENSYLMQVFKSSSSEGKYTPAVTTCYSERDGAKCIKGEVYEVDNHQLEELDKLEENGVRYQRKLVTLENGTSALMYFFIADEQPVPEQQRHIIERQKNHVNSYQWKELPPELP